MFMPLHVYWRGMGWPSVKAELVSLIAEVVPGGVWVVGGFGFVAVGCLAQATANIISRAIDPALRFMFITGEQKSMQWRWGCRDLHALLHYLDDFVMGHREFEDDLVSFRGNLRMV